MSRQTSLRIAGKAKYKRMIELDNTMLFVYANPEPMLQIERLEVDNSSNEIK